MTHPNDAELWARLVRSHRQGRFDEFKELVKSFLVSGVNRTPLLKEALLGKGQEVAVYLLALLSTSDLLPLFAELLSVASYSDKLADAVHTAILRMPRDWVIEHIDLAAEPIFITGTGDEFRHMLDLYRLIDRDLALKLASRALAHQNPDIQEAGQDTVDRFFEK